MNNKSKKGRCCNVKSSAKILNNNLFFISFSLQASLNGYFNFFLPLTAAGIAQSTERITEKRRSRIDFQHRANTNKGTVFALYMTKLLRGLDDHVIWLSCLQQEMITNVSSISPFLLKSWTLKYSAFTLKWSSNGSAFRRSSRTTFFKRFLLN